MTTHQASPAATWHAAAIGAAGGLASVAMFYSAARGAVGLSILLLPLVPLPMLIVGFGWGRSAAIAAALVSTVVLAIAVAPSFAVGYGLALALPAVGLTHLLLLARYENGALVDWYPIGRMLVALALYGAALPVLLISLDGGSYAVMVPEFTRFFEKLAQQAPPDSGWRSLDPSQVQALVDLWVQMMPAVVASYWTAFFAVNAYLAGRIVRVSGLLLRPWPNLHWLTYPKTFVAAFALALVGVVVGGSAGVLGVGALGAFTVAFMLQGLSVVHAVAHHRSATWLISAVYAGIIVAGALVMPLLAVLSITETLTRLRSRVVPIPPALPLGSI